MNTIRFIAGRRQWTLVAMATLAAWVGSAGVAQASVTLDFSSQSSEKSNSNHPGYNPANLSAEVLFEIVTNQLKITIENKSDFQIEGLYFNTGVGTGLGGWSFGTATASATGGTINAAPTIKNRTEINTSADGFGRFDWKLDFGAGDAARLDAHTTATVLVDIATQGALFNFDQLYSTGPPAGNGLQLGAIKFEGYTIQGDFLGASAFGAAKGDSIAAPEPSVVVLTALGMLTPLGVAGARRWRRRSEVDQA